MTITPMSVSDPFEYIEEHHKLIATLMDQVLDAAEGSKRSRDELFTELRGVLMWHFEIAERVVFPAMSSLDMVSEYVRESENDHRVLRGMLMEISDVPTETLEWREKFETLKEHFELHVENEDADILKKGHKEMSDDDKREMAVKIQEFEMSATA